MADTKGNGPRPSTGTPTPTLNASNTPQHVLQRLGKKTDFVASGPKTPA